MAVDRDDVRLVIDTSLTDDQVDRMLITAENIITTHIDPLSSPDVTVTVRSDIKVWLAAHFCAVRDRRVREDSADGVRTVFEGKVDLGLDSTIYGQQARMVDPTGMLGKVGMATRKRLVFRFSNDQD